MQKFQEEKTRDNGLARAWEESRSALIAMSNSGEIAVKKFRACSSGEANRTRNRWQKKLQEMRKTRKRLMKTSGRRAGISQEMVVMTKQRYKDTHNSRSPEKDGLHLQQREVEDGVWEDTVLCRVRPKGEWSYKDEKYEDVHEEEELDDGKNLIRAGQLAAKLNHVTAPFAAAVKGAGYMPEPENASKAKAPKAHDSLSENEDVGDDSDYDLKPLDAVGLRKPDQASAAARPSQRPAKATGVGTATPAENVAQGSRAPLPRPTPARGAPTGSAAARDGAATNRRPSPPPPQEPAASASSDETSAATQVLDSCNTPDLVGKLESLEANVLSHPDLQSGLSNSAQQDTASKAMVGVGIRAAELLIESNTLLHAIKQKAKAKRYKELPNLSERAASMFDAQVTSRLRAWKKLATAFAATKTEPMVMQTAVNEVSRGELALPPSIIIKADAASAQEYAKHGNMAEFCRLLDSETSRIANVVGPGEKAKLVARDIVEKALLKITPAHGRNAVPTDMLPDVLAMFCAPIAEAALLLPESEMDLAILQNLVGEDTSPSALDLRKDAIDFFDKRVPETSMLAGLAAQAKFKDMVRAIDNKLAVLRGDQGGKAALRTWSERLHRIEELETNEGDQVELLSVIQQCPQLTLKACAYVGDLDDPDHADSTAFQQNLEAVVNYQKGALIQLEEALGGALTDMAALTDTPRQREGFAKLVAELAARCTQMVPPSLPPRWQGFVTASRLISEIVSFRLRSHWHSCRLVRETHNGQVAPSEEEFRNLVTHFSRMKANITAMNVEVAKVKALEGVKLEKLHEGIARFQEAFGQSRHGLSVFATQFQKFRRVVLAVVHDDEVDAQDVKMYRRDNAMLLRQLAHWSDTPQRDVRAIDLGLVILMLKQDQAAIAPLMAATTFEKADIDVIHGFAQSLQLTDAMNEEEQMTAAQRLSDNAEGVADALLGLVKTVQTNIGVAMQNLQDVVLRQLKGKTKSLRKVPLPLMGPGWARVSVQCLILYCALTKHRHPPCP